METDEQREVGWHFTKILPKIPEGGGVTPAVYLSESKAKDLYGEMTAISESDLTSINGAFNTPEHVEAFKQVRAKVKQLSLIHISEPTRPRFGSRMPSSA